MTQWVMLIGFLFHLLNPLPNFTERTGTLFKDSLPWADALIKRAKVSWLQNVWVSAMLFPSLIALVACLVYFTPSAIRFLLSLLLYLVMASSSYTWAESMRLFFSLRIGNHDEVISIVAIDSEEDQSEEVIIRRSNEILSNNLEEFSALPVFYLAIGGIPFMAFAGAILWTHRHIQRDQENTGMHQVIERAFVFLSFLPVRLFSFMMIISARILRVRWESAWKCYCDEFSKNISLSLAVGETALGIENFPVDSEDQMTWLPEPRDIIRMNHLTFITACGYALFLLLIRGTILWVL